MRSAESKHCATRLAAWLSLPLYCSLSTRMLPVLLVGIVYVPGQVRLPDSGLTVRTSTVGVSISRYAVADLDVDGVGRRIGALGHLQGEVTGPRIERFLEMQIPNRQKVAW